jgi:hypothetical protein
MVAQLADPDRGWDAIVIGEYERAFYGSQYALMSPLFEHYGVQLWMPEAGGRVDFASEHDEQAMTVLGLSSKREVTRTSIRVRTAMAVQAMEQGRYLGGRPPYGYCLGDAGPHPNKAHAAWGRRAHRLVPDPETAHIVRWIFAQRLAGHSVARIARALNDAGVPCPSAVDPGRNPHRTGAGWTLGTVATILGNPRYTGHQAWNRQRTDKAWPTRPTSAWGTSRCSGGTCPTGGSSPPGRHTRPWSARKTSSRPRTSALAAGRHLTVTSPLRKGGGTCWPGCSPAERADGGWNQRGLTAGPPTAAATGTQPPARRAWSGRGTPTSARTPSWRTFRPCTCCLPSPPEDRGGGVPAAGPTSGIKRKRRTPGASGSPRPGDNPACPETGVHGDLLCPSVCTKKPMAAGG